MASNTKFALETRLRASAVYGLLAQEDRNPWLKRCLELPEEWLTTPPIKGEAASDVFKSLEQGIERAMAYGFYAGISWNLMRSTKEGGVKTRQDLFCKFHSVGTANKRHLQDTRVRIDPVTKQVVSDRKRNTTHSRCGCPVIYKLMYSKKDDVWYGHLNLGEGVHLCNFPMNPLRDQKHKKTLVDWKNQNSWALRLRSRAISYFDAKAILKDEGVQVFIEAKEYYNLVRKKSYKDVDDLNAGALLLETLDAMGCHYDIRTVEDWQGDELRSQKIVQIVWYSTNALPWARRFCSNALVIADGTFRTNKHGLPLLIATGRSCFDGPGKKIFPFAYSWCPSEGADSWAFFWDYVRREFWTGMPDPDVLLVDLGAGMVAAKDNVEAVPDEKLALPESKLQFCNWHAEKAIMTHLTKAGKYTSAQLYGELVEGVTYVGIEDYIWRYLLSPSMEEKEVNRDVLYSHLQNKEVQYLKDNYLPREERLIRCHTKENTNLNCESTQSGEAINPLIHKVTQHQMTLEQAARAIMERTEDFYTDLSKEVDKEEVKQPMGINPQVFGALIRQVSLFAIEKVREQWDKLVNGEELPPCTGQVNKQLLLPCAHDLRPFHSTGFVVPKTMVHPRYYLKQQVCLEVNWKPSAKDMIKMLDKSANLDILDTFAQAMHVLEGLSGHERDRMHQKMLTLTNKARSIGEYHKVMAEVPIQLPDDLPRRAVARRDRQGQRVLSAHERVKKSQKQAEKAAATAQRVREVLAQLEEAQQEEEQPQPPSQVVWSQASVIEPFLTTTQREIREGKRPEIREPEIREGKRSLAYRFVGSEETNSQVDDEFLPIPEPRLQSEPPEQLPPPSTAPPALTLLGKRQRPAPGFHRALNDDNSQEIRAKRRI